MAPPGALLLATRVEGPPVIGRTGERWSNSHRLCVRL